MVTWQDEVTQLVFEQLSNYSGLYMYRCERTSLKVHIAVKRTGKSLCGREVWQATWRPRDDDRVCGNCLRVVQNMGLTTPRR